MQTLVMIAGLALFAWFVWAARYHFAASKWSRQTQLLSVGSVAGVVLFGWLMATEPGGRLELATAIVLFALSAGLFYAALTASRGTTFNGVFAATSPSRVVATGPYAVIRHPFYTSYLIYWLGCLAATPHLLMAVPLVGLGIAYAIAARREEATFLNSPLADDYARYRLSTGMFWPSLRRPHLDRAGE